MAKVLKERASTIDRNIQSAIKQNKDAEELVSQQQETLQAARIEAKEMRQKTEELTQKEKEKLMQEAKNQSKKLIENTKKELDLEVLKIKKELTAETVDLTIQLTEKLINKSVSEQDHKDINKQYLNKVQEK